MCKFETINGVIITYERVHQAMREEGISLYEMSLVGEERGFVERAVNVGIDSHLEACFVPERGDSFESNGLRLECKVSSESLPVLLRRLYELEEHDENDDAPYLLANDILTTLGINDEGEYVGSEDFEDSRR